MSSSIFKVHENTLLFVKALLEDDKDTDIVYLHGDGNVYNDKASSDFRKDFSNPGPSGGSTPPAKYRVTFKNAKQVPGTLEELDKLFYEQKRQEDLAQQKADTTTAKTVKTFSMPKKAVAAEVATGGGMKTQAQLDAEELDAAIAAEEAEKLTKK